MTLIILDILLLINDSGGISFVITSLAATSIAKIKTNNIESFSFNFKHTTEEELAKVMRSLDIKTGALHGCIRVEF